MSIWRASGSVLGGEGVSWCGRRGGAVGGGELSGCGGMVDGGCGGCGDGFGFGSGSGSGSGFGGGSGGAGSGEWASAISGRDVLVDGMGGVVGALWKFVVGKG